jgi:hypothetical protein
MYHLLTLKVYKHPDIEGAYYGIVRSEISGEEEKQIFSNASAARNFCAKRHDNIVNYHAGVTFKDVQVVRKGMWCYNVFVSKDIQSTTWGDVWGSQKGMRQ